MLHDPSAFASYFKNRLVLIAFEQALNAATEEKKKSRNIFFPSIELSPKKLHWVVVFVWFFLKPEKCRHTHRTKFVDSLMKRKSIYLLHGIFPPPNRLSELYNSMRYSASQQKKVKNSCGGLRLRLLAINLELPLSERTKRILNAPRFRCRIFIFDHES